MDALMIVGVFVVFLLLFLARSAIKENERVNNEHGYKEKEEIAAQKFKERRESRRDWFWNNKAKDIPESYLSSLLDLFCGDEIDLGRVVSLLGKLQEGELYYEDDKMPWRVESCSDTKYASFIREHYIFEKDGIRFGAFSDALKNTYFVGYTVGYFLQNKYGNYDERFNESLLDVIWEKGDWDQDLKRVFEVGVENGRHCWFDMWTGM